ncbi:MAG TPA: M15 family metallopeptidase [Candidatus Limnocylindrales bacterium]|nr:M15 family metallopeptidase [Candidatus Limnocylindrales bacterium]
MTTRAPAPRRRRFRAFALALLAAAAAAGAAPAFTIAADPAADLAPLPACVRADDPAPYRAYSQWASTLLDTRFRVARAYVPPGLVSTANAGTNGGYRVRRLVIPDLGAMVLAARRAGVSLRITSGYRSYDAQKALYRSFVALLGPGAAALRAARPGHSEHQLGTAMDLADRPGAYAWVARNAWRYGFVVSYPPGERSVSCYRSEPWHVRHVGRTRAAAVHASGLTPRAWLWLNVVSRPS